VRFGCKRLLPLARWFCVPILARVLSVRNLFCLKDAASICVHDLTERSLRVLCRVSPYPHLCLARFCTLPHAPVLHANRNSTWLSNEIVLRAYHYSCALVRVIQTTTQTSIITQTSTLTFTVVGYRHPPTLLLGFLILSRLTTFIVP
jgi:hypothetical protein